MSVLNSTILEKAFLEGSNDYQQRLGNPTITGYAAHVARLFNPLNADMFNQFTGLLNGLMGTYIESKLFENPLRVLKKPAAGPYMAGFSERHIAVQYLKAHSMNFDQDALLLKVERPEYREWFYSITEPRQYRFSFSRVEVQQAFANDGYGFEDLLTATITQTYSSANYDEMNLMLHAFAEAEERMGGLYKQNISTLPSDKASGQELLAAIRAYAGRMTFPSTHFNHIDVPVHETMSSEETSLVLWVTPEIAAAIDVYALADLFHLERANVNYRVLTVPEFPIPGVYAALTGEDFIYCKDIYTVLEPPFYNATNMTYKYVYNVLQMIGVNPAAQCVLFGDFETTGIDTIKVTPSGLSFTPDSGEVAPGGELQLTVNLTGTVSGDEAAIIGVEPDAALYSVVATRDVDDETVAIELNSRTYVDNFGILHVQKTGLVAGDVLTITAKSVYVNPSGDTSVFTDDFTATII